MLSPLSLPWMNCQSGDCVIIATTYSLLSILLKHPHLPMLLSLFWLPGYVSTYCSRWCHDDRRLQEGRKLCTDQGRDEELNGRKGNQLPPIQLSHFGCRSEGSFSSYYKYVSSLLGVYVFMLVQACLYLCVCVCVCVCLYACTVQTIHTVFSPFSMAGSLFTFAKLCMIPAC